MSQIFPRLSPEGNCLECLLTSGSSVLSSTWGIFDFDACDLFPIFLESCFQTSEIQNRVGGKDLSVTSWLKSEPCKWEEGRQPDISKGGAQRRYERGWDNPVKETKRPFS